MQPTAGSLLGQQRQGKGRANTWCNQAAKPSVGPGALHPFRSSLEGLGGGGERLTASLQAARPLTWISSEPGPSWAPSL